MPKLRTDIVILPNGQAWRAVKGKPFSRILAWGNKRRMIRTAERAAYRKATISQL